MGIDLTKKQPGSIDLSKGQVINLKKTSPDTAEFDLSKITIGLGWDITGGRSFDLDASCMLLDKDGKLASSDDVVSYQQKRHGSGKVWSTGDNLTGEGAGDDEQIVAQLESIDSKYNKLVFFANIYSGKSRGQRFSDIENAYCRAIDAKGREIARFNISGNSSLNDKYSFIFGEVYRGANGWEFKALGEAHNTDTISGITEQYKGKKSIFGF
jgi:tellurium resistance protein TerD